MAGPFLKPYIMQNLGAFDLLFLNFGNWLHCNELTLAYMIFQGEWLNGYLYLFIKLCREGLMFPFRSRGIAGLGERIVSMHEMGFTFVTHGSVMN